MYAFAILLACTTISSKRPAAASQLDVEVTIREMMPTPVRCNRTTEPLSYCRHDNAADHTMVLELASGTDGPAASLTYDYDDAKRHELFAVMRRFFVVTVYPLRHLMSAFCNPNGNPIIHLRMAGKFCAST